MVHLTFKCTRFQASFAHSDSGTISVRKHIPFNSIYCLFDSTTLWRNNFLQQFLSYIKLCSFFVVYVHYPFTPSLLLTQTLHKRISQKDYTKGFYCFLRRSKNTLNVVRLLLIPKFVPILKIVFLFTLRWRILLTVLQQRRLLIKKSRHGQLLSQFFHVLVFICQPLVKFLNDHFSLLAYFRHMARLLSKFFDQCF